MFKSEYTDYNGLVELARQTATEHAKTWVPRLCEALQRENPEMSKEDVRETVTNDCKDFWSRATISKFMPDEYKDPQKSEAGRKGREKQRLEEPIPAGTVPAEKSSVSSTGQESESFNRQRQDVGVGREMYEKAQREFKARLKVIEQEVEEKDAELYKKDKEIEDLKKMQSTPDMPIFLEDERLGPVKVPSDISNKERMVSTNFR
jgi:hypothetical protein